MKPGERPYAEDRPLNRNKKEAAGKAEKPEPTAPPVKAVSPALKEGRT